jgi:F0F1-type ATP synthase membrane subunit b/b'
MNFNLDAKGFIAVAFFVCIGLIIKFSGKRILSVLNSKKDSINENLDNGEKELKKIEEEHEFYLNEEKNAKNFANQLIKNADQERTSSLAKFKKDIEIDLQRQIERQKETNEKIHLEIQDGFEKIAWDSSCELLKEKLIGDEFGSKPNKEIHKSLIDQLILKASS